MSAELDPSVLHDWFAVSAAGKVKADTLLRTQLLGRDIALWRDVTGRLHGADLSACQGEECLVQERYGYAWLSLGAPQQDLFHLPEFAQAGRRFVDCGAFGIRTSGLRIVENFLDMGHFPYVHTDILGQEPHTEVRSYNVTTDPVSNEIWAKDCRFWQPKAAASATDGLDVDYTYRVMQPFSAMLYKTCPARPGERDVIGLYVQPLKEDECKAHLWLLIFDNEHSDSEIIGFQQTIFGQDKPILESQSPALIPLDPRSEIPTRADAMSIAYRRWLRAKGLQFGVQKTA